MAENKETHVALTQNVGEQVIKRVNNLCEAGFTVPKDYNYVNAIKMSMLKLQELKDKSGELAEYAGKQFADIWADLVFKAR